MSEWEDIFGAGVSAESVIANIEAANAAEGKADRHYEKRQKRRLLTAFNDRSVAKQQFIKELCDRLDGLRAEGLDGGLLDTPAFEPDWFRSVESRFNLPARLLHAINSISHGLISAPGSGYDEERSVGRAKAWLRECIDSINPGVDLRFVEYRLVARVALIGEKCVSWVPPEPYRSEGISTYERCKACLEIIYARARGVFFPSPVVNAAIEAAAGSISPEWSNGDQVYLDSYHDFGAVILSCAASPDPKVRAKAIYWAVAHEREECPYGFGAERYQFWVAYSKTMLALIKEAPRHRVMALKVESAIGHQVGSVEDEV